MSEDQLFHAAASEQRRLAARRVDDLIIAGARNAAEILDNPLLQERTAMEAVMRTMRPDEDGQREQPGPSRRKAPKVSARKRQRQARKRNR